MQNNRLFFDINSAPLFFNWFFNFIYLHVDSIWARNTEGSGPSPRARERVGESIFPGLIMAPSQLITVHQIRFQCQSQSVSMAPLSWLASPRTEHLGWAGKQPRLSQTLPQGGGVTWSGCPAQSNPEYQLSVLSGAALRIRGNCSLKSPCWRLSTWRGLPQASDEECLP